MSFKKRVPGTICTQPANSTLKSNPLEIFTLQYQNSRAETIPDT